MNLHSRLFAALLLLFVVLPCSADESLGKHGYAKSGNVKIHFVTAGEGPLVVMLHGFPDYWYTWRKQMPELAKHFQVVAIDQRGYNKSDKPEGVGEYSLFKLAADVRAVILHFGRKKAVIVGHDWGGAVAWTFAMSYPEMTDRLVILNLPHPNGLRRELAKGKDQYEASAYARGFQEDDAASKLTAEGLAGWVRDPNAKQKYVQAFKRSSFDAMLNYYKANFPKPAKPSANGTSTGTPLPKVKCSVLMLHGLKDKALLPSALNDTWEWLESDLTLVTIPDAAHFVQQDAADRVTKTMVNWLVNQPSRRK